MSILIEFSKSIQARIKIVQFKFIFKHIYSSMERYISLKETVWSKSERTQLFLENAIFDERSDLEIIDCKLMPNVSIDKS